ncbi:MAG: hypothetical protein QNK24_06040 [Desulfuromusa sp.]|nr:hypothetical protein [Desulfuromusa sp.]
MLDTFSFLHNRRKTAKKGIRFIFCINSGRAGSEYLATLLGTAPMTYSFHEPEPQMIGDYLLAVARNGLEKTFNDRRTKSKTIVKIASQYPDQSVYVETNHMFIKTFYDVVLRDLRNVQVIHLQRDLLQTLKSFVQLCYFSDQNSAWPDWMISPNSQTAVIKAIDGDNKLDYIDLSIAYLIDIEARATAFKQMYPHIPFHETDINDLNDIDKTKALFANLGLSFTTETEDIIGGKINMRANVKKKYANQVADADLLDRIRDYLKRGDELGIKFPNRVLKYS